MFTSPTKYLHSVVSDSFSTLLQYNLPGSSNHAVLHAQILGWVANPFQGSSRPRDQSWVSCIAGGLFTIRATREAQIPSQQHLYEHLFGRIPGCGSLATPHLIAPSSPPDSDAQAEAACVPSSNSWSHLPLVRPMRPCPSLLCLHPQGPRRGLLGRSWLSCPSKILLSSFQTHAPRLNSPSASTFVSLPSRPTA